MIDMPQEKTKNSKNRSFFSTQEDFPPMLCHLTFRKRLLKQNKIVGIYLNNFEAKSPPFDDLSEERNPKWSIPIQWNV